MLMWQIYLKCFNELIIKLNDISKVETYRRSSNFKKKDNLIVKNMQ